MKRCLTGARDLPVKCATKYSFQVTKGAKSQLTVCDFNDPLGQSSHALEVLFLRQGRDLELLLTLALTLALTLTRGSEGLGMD